MAIEPKISDYEWYVLSQQFNIIEQTDRHIQKFLKILIHIELCKTIPI